MNLEIFITNAKRHQNDSLLIMTVNRGIQSCIFFFWHTANIYYMRSKRLYQNNYLKNQLLINVRFFALKTVTIN